MEWGICWSYSMQFLQPSGWIGWMEKTTHAKTVEAYAVLQGLLHLPKLRRNNAILWSDSRVIINPILSSNFGPYFICL